MADISELFQDQPLIEDQQQAAAPELEQASEQEAPFSLEQSQPETQQPEQHQQPKHVPLQALQEERQRRQEYQQELDRERQRAAQMEQRFQQMVERMQAAQQPQQQPQQVEIPPFEEDPSGHVAALRQRYEAELNELRGYQQQQVTMSQEQQRQYEVIQRTSAAEAAFMAATPDYRDTTSAFTQRKLAEYQALGLSVAEAQNVVRQDIFNMSAFALQRGTDPAQAFYNMAKAAIGSQPAQQQAPQQGQPRTQTGQFAPKMPTSLSNVPGTPTQPDEGGAMTLEKIASLSDAEFDKLWKQMERGQTVMPKV